MTPFTSLRRRSGRNGQSGQMIVVFALCLIAIIAMAGLLIDGGNAWANRRQAQAAADTATLAAAVAASKFQTPAEIANAADNIALANGFARAYTDCSGVAHPTAADDQLAGVVVNVPPRSGTHMTDGYVEVLTNRPMRTTFAGVVGQTCWMISARAVASIKTEVASCSLCALSDGPEIHKVLLDNGANIRVDGDIRINGKNTYSGIDAIHQCGVDPCLPFPAACHPNYTWDFVQVCGDVIELHQTGGPTHTHLSAKHIMITGGWETRGGNVMQADEYAGGAVSPSNPLCPYAPEPPAYTINVVPPVTAQICIGAPPIHDPYNDPDNLAAQIPVPNPQDLSTCRPNPVPCGPVEGLNGCVREPPVGGFPMQMPAYTGTLASPHQVVIAGGTNPSYWTICPGIYYGGLSIFGDNRSPHVIMLPGIYYMVGGGFEVSGTAWVTSVSSQGDGVMIYNTGAAQSFTSSTQPRVEPVPPCIPPSSCLPVTLSGGTNGLTSNVNPSAAGQTVIFTMRLQHPAAPPIGGTVTFYDGEDLIPGCTAVPLTFENLLHSTATCSVTYFEFGIRSITAVYSGDLSYAGNDDTLTQRISTPAPEHIDRISLCTAFACGGPVRQGKVTLHAMTSTRYSGVLLFQDRTSDLDLQIWPGDSEAPACTGTWMTDATPGHGGSVPDPCGPLGGLSGTIYAPHVSTGGTDGDALVDFRASGAANLQVIAATIYLNYDNDIRFSFRADLFANGKIRLVE